MHGRNAAGASCACAYALTAAMMQVSTPQRQVRKGGSLMARDRKHTQAPPATGSAVPLLQLLHLGPRDIAARTSLEIRIEPIGVPHDHRAGFEARHSFFEAAFGDSLDEILLAEHLEAL